MQMRFGLEDYEDDVRQKVQEFLDTIPDDMLRQLKHFDSESFYFDSRSLQLNELLERLPAYLPSCAQSASRKEFENEPPAAVIDRLRKLHGWTIEQLALEADVDVKQIYKIKLGKGVHTDTIRKIAQALGCKPGELMPV